MAKIIGKIVTERHTLGVLVKRPYGNETIVELAEGESVDSILESTQTAINRVAPYARNCPPHYWTGRGTTYVTIQPISGKVHDQFIERISELKVSGAIISKEASTEGRIQLIVYTPSPDDPILPAGRKMMTSGGIRWGSESWD